MSAAGRSHLTKKDVRVDLVYMTYMTLIKTSIYIKLFGDLTGFLLGDSYEVVGINDKNI